MAIYSFRCEPELFAMFFVCLQRAGTIPNSYLKPPTFLWMPQLRLMRFTRG
jgi:hypothetical protein